MTAPTRLRELRVRIDRLPAGWVIVVAGLVLQVALSTTLLGLAAAGDDRVGVLVAAVLLAIVAAAAVAALPALALLWLGRLPRTASVLAALVAVGTLVLNEFHPSVWPFSLALFLAAVRTWAGSGVDAIDHFDHDPSRFERVDPPDSSGEDT